MSDDKIRTIVHTDEGELEFQHYFVRRRCEPRVLRIAFESSDAASPSPAFDAALAAASTDAIVICPSNPFLSIDPILQIAGVRERIAQSRAPVIAVSPIVAGDAIKGPAAKIMRELGREASAFEVARHYRGLIDGIVIDALDAALKPQIEALGIEVVVTDTIMKSRNDQIQLARTAIEFAAALSDTVSA
jgi:LPPG:FO 2-phospho-L-lactate transferase